MTRGSALWQMHAAAVLFGISGIFGKLIISGVAVLVFGRAVFAVLSLSVLLIKSRRLPWQGMTARRIFNLLAMGLLLVAHWVTFFIGIKVGGVAVATLGFACFPAFVALLESVLYREQLTKTEYTLIGLVSLGLVLVTPSFDFANNATEGLIWGILSGFTYALLTIGNRSVAAKMSGVQVNWWENLSVMLCLLPFAAADIPQVPWLDWVWIACLGLLCTGLSYSFFINALKVINARTAAMIIALEPVYAILVAWVLFHEQPGLRMVAGGALIIFAVAWSTRQK
ncbi:DMT family transporter [Budviciaceae bacterium CWB-B4]|uniref:DMT family transporter n=1 Tax=Limnobaculum xujianqingii TaxID=2738837 RepID=A0A9D7AF77_9GAMM|nr:DMT family transporter [Limnobaculum xujianqingii]MBK5071570.1 DMT family transporter [Limnobaculum xujianqingii]MBK5174879.1 DMT family transporter [Limnobaculum xujianqingii]